METIERRLLATGLLLLTLGLFLPWVRMEPLPKRHDNLRQIGKLVASPKWPEEARELLGEKGLTAGMSPDQIWTAIGNAGHAKDFSLVDRRQSLHSWHFLMGDVPLLLRVTVIVLLIWFLVSVVLLVKSFGNKSQNTSQWPEDFTNNDASVSSKMPPPPFIGSLLLLGLFALQLPYLDTFGYRGDFSMALLDILTGARVALAPRLIVPLGLFLIMLAGVDTFFNRRRSSKVASNYGLE